jgi:hypothetical protein
MMMMQLGGWSIGKKGLGWEGSDEVRWKGGELVREREGACDGIIEL